MTGLKTIVATGVLVFAATAVAFGGVHLGQPSAGASPAATASSQAAKATYTVRLTATQLEHLAELLGGQQTIAHAQHHARHDADHHTRVRTVAHRAASVPTQASWSSSITTHHSTTTHNCPTTRCISHAGSCGDGGGRGGCGDGGGCD